MKFLKYFISIAFITILIASCGKKETKFSNTPSLKLLYQNTDKINFMDSTSFLLVNFEFTDGDGDIARRDPNIDTSIVTLVYRVNDTTNPRYVFPMPVVSEDVYQKNGGIKGTMHLNMPNYYFYPRVDTAHREGLDTMILGVFIQDYAGNSSDTINVGPIYIAP